MLLLMMMKNNCRIALMQQRNKQVTFISWPKLNDSSEEGNDEKKLITRDHFQRTVRPGYCLQEKDKFSTQENYLASAGGRECPHTSIKRK